MTLSRITTLRPPPLFFSISLVTVDFPRLHVPDRAQRLPPLSCCLLREVLWAISPPYGFFLGNAVPGLSWAPIGTVV